MSTSLNEYTQDPVEEDINVAALTEQLPIVQYLREQGADIHVNNDEELISEAHGGHLPVVLYLIEKGAGIYVGDNAALIWASKHDGHLIDQGLYNLSTDE